MDGNLIALSVVVWIVGAAAGIALLYGVVRLAVRHELGARKTATRSRSAETPSASTPPRAWWEAS